MYLLRPTQKICILVFSLDIGINFYYIPVCNSNYFTINAVECRLDDNKRRASPINGILSYNHR